MEMGPEECILRLCYVCEAERAALGHKHPSDVDPQTKRLRPDAISRLDLTTRGFSVQRRRTYTLAMAQADAEERADRDPDMKIALAGMVCTSVGLVFSLTGENGDRLFDVGSDADVQRPAHAFIKLVRNAKPSEVKKYRKALADQFSMVEDIGSLLHTPGYFSPVASLLRVLSRIANKARCRTQRVFHFLSYRKTTIE